MVLIAYTLVSYGILHFVPAATIHKLGQQTTLYFAQAAFGTIWRAPTEHWDYHLDGGLFKLQDYDLPPHRVRHGCSESAAIR